MAATGEPATCAPLGCGAFSIGDGMEINDQRASTMESHRDAIACLLDACRRLPADALHQLTSAAYDDDPGAILAWMSQATTWQLRLVQLALLTGLRAAILSDQEASDGK